MKQREMNFNIPNLYVTNRILLSVGINKTPYWEMGGTERLVTVCHRIAPGDWHIVNDPLMSIALVDLLNQKIQLLLVFGV